MDVETLALLQWHQGEDAPQLPPLLLKHGSCGCWTRPGACCDACGGTLYRPPGGWLADVAEMPL